MNRVHLILLLVTLGCSKTTEISPFDDRPTSTIPEFATSTFRSDVSELIAQNRYIAAVNYIKTADPSVLADYDKVGFLAVGEDLIVLPGVYPGHDYVRDRDWFIPGTSDSVENDAWQNTATEFAARYNRHRIGK